jgi:hypothetical protein
LAGCDRVSVRLVAAAPDRSVSLVPRVFETLEITSPPLHLRRQVAATLLDSSRSVNDVLDVSVRALADLIGVRINFPNPRENQIGPARKSRSECWPGSWVEFPDVSRRVAREGFIAKVLDEFFTMQALPLSKQPLH